jgi:hypothetical protein
MIRRSTKTMHDKHTKIRLKNILTNGMNNESGVAGIVRNSISAGTTSVKADDSAILSIIRTLARHFDSRRHSLIDDFSFIEALKQIS